MASQPTRAALVARYEYGYRAGARGLPRIGSHNQPCRIYYCARPECRGYRQYLADVRRQHAHVWAATEDAETRQCDDCGVIEVRPNHA